MASGPRRISITRSRVYEGMLYVEQSEDGTDTRFDYYVMVERDGHEFGHAHPFRHRSSAQEFADRVAARGYIVPDHWSYIEPPTSLEERWNAMAQQEHEVAMGCRSEDDMYHGIPYR